MTEKTPKLLPVPNIMHHLTVKATVNGITVLKDGRFKKRYTGSSTAAVDINGKFYAKAGELKKLISGDAGKDKKNPRRRQSAGESEIETRDLENSDINLSTKKNIPREYRVNKTEVRARLLAMINSMKGKNLLYFWTVTFPRGIDDNIAYKAFNTWLTTLRQKKMLRDYLWVAERQENGTIHFHIAIPHRMNVKTANAAMRTTLTNFAAANLIPWNKWQCKKYNGVDICKNRKTGRVTNFAIKKGARALATYLTKYVTKNDTGFPHLAWHNSRGFSALFTGVTMTRDEFYSSGYEKFILYKPAVQNEFFSFYAWRTGMAPPGIVNHLYELNSYLQSLN